MTGLTLCPESHYSISWHRMINHVGRILVTEPILLVMPENMPRWRERFSFVDIAMLQGER